MFFGVYFMFFQSRVFRSTMMMEFLTMLSVVVSLLLILVLGFRFGFANYCETFIFKFLDLVLLELTNFFRWLWRNAIASFSLITFGSSLLIFRFVLSSFTFRSVSSSSFLVRSISSTLTITFAFIRSFTILATSSSSAFRFLFLCWLSAFLRCFSWLFFFCRFLRNYRSSFFFNSHFRSFLSHRFRFLFLDYRLRLWFGFNFSSWLFSFHFR